MVDYMDDYVYSLFIKLEHVFIIPAQEQRELMQNCKLQIEQINGD